MTAEFLLYANLVLLLRLWLLLTDEPSGLGAWGTKAVIEVVGLGLFVPSTFWFGAVGATLAANGFSGYWDRRGRERNAGHLVAGLVQLAVLSVCFSPMSGVTFRPGLIESGHSLALWSTMGMMVVGVFDLRVLKIVFGLLLAANEANLVIRALLGGLHLKPGPKILDPGEYNRGRVIGLLERVLIYCFVLSGQFGAIGFTLAAKGFTRFKELEDRSFAEYVLIGTLLSSSLAMGAGVLVKFVL